MATTSVPRAVALLAFALCASCTGANDEPPPLPAELPTFTMRVPQRSLEEVMARGEAMVAVLGGGAAAKAAVRPRLLESSRQGGDRWTARLAGELLLSYDRRRDELRVEVDALAPRPTDRGEATARSVAGGAWDDLVSRKLIDRRHHDRSRPVVSVVRNATDEWPLEYVVSYVRRINGIPVPGTSTDVTVEASGKLRAVSVGGPAPDSRFDGRLEIPSGSSNVLFRRDVPLETVRARFAEENPMATLHSLELTYVPTTRGGGVPFEVRPLYVARFDVAVVRDGGATGARRTMTLGYAIDDPNAEPVTL